jgi:sugar phosphate isomerase/epimerase
MMNSQNRRSFLKGMAGLTGAVAVAARTTPLWASLEEYARPLGLPIGCQTYPVRQLMGQDIPGTLKTLHEAGFERVELCSPYGYATSGFGGFQKYTGKQFRKLMGDHDLKCESAHFDPKELRDSPDKTIGWASEAGLKQMVFWSLDGPKTPTMDDIKRVAEEFNKFGALTAKHGIQLATHNETFETSMVGDQRTYDVLIGLTDPKLTKYQFQISTIGRGFDAVEYFTKYPGRFQSMHVQDWDAANKKTTAVGQGSLDWKKIFAAARVGGIKNYFVELNLDQMKASVPVLKALKV